MGLPEEEELDVAAGLGDAGDGADHRDRVEPLPDATAPEQHRVGLGDAFHDALEHAARGGRRLGREAKRHDVDQSAQRRIGGVRVDIDPPEGGEQAEPQVTLAFARAQKRVTGQEREQLPLDDLAMHPVALGSIRTGGEEGQNLDQQRVVEVVDHLRAAPCKRAHRSRAELLGEDDVRAACEVEEPSVGEPGPDEHVGEVDLDVGLGRDDQRDLGAVRELAREVEVADAGAGHLAADAVVRDDEGAGHRPSSSGTRRTARRGVFRPKRGVPLDLGIRAQVGRLPHRYPSP